jgi:Fe-S oxidoreductase
MSGQMGPDGLTDRGLYDILDLCLSCKGCKSECPSNVDLARLKSEFLQGYHDRHGRRFRDRLVGGSSSVARLAAGPAAPLINRVQQTRPFRSLLEAAAGFDRRRVLPAYARHSLQHWFARRSPPAEGPAGRVALFADTYLNYHEPHQGRAAVELLEACGYAVELVAPGCCQRPRISHGLLREARRDGEKTLRGLDEVVRRGVPVLVCEPSCASALTDDLPDLVEDRELGARVAKGVHPIDTFVARELEAGRLAGPLRSPHPAVLVHGHCHQKALYGAASMLRILRSVEGLAVEEVDSGCCGMAGSFGYEREHYDLSLKIGERRLFPAVRAAAPETAVVACGFSCRHQLADALGVRARHWVEVVQGPAAP